MRPLHEQVVVLTGASSGIGRETAVELGRRGASVVLAARSEEGLRDVAREVTAAGGRALPVPTDVADWPQVERLASAAVGQFGRIDTWVNDAAVSTYGPVADTPVEDMEQVIRVGLMGVIHGCKAALPHLRRHGGTIINVSSVLGKMAVPLQAAYCAAKHGVIGFSDALRLELAREGDRVKVCTILPGSTNTPFFEHARARLGGAKPMPIPPAYDPRAVADAIAFACEHPRREVVVGAAGKMFTLLQRLHPALNDWLLSLGDGGAKLQTSDRPDDRRDNLFTPVPGPQPARGEWGDVSIGGSPYTRWVEQQPVVKAALVGAAAVAAVGLLRWLSGGRSGGGRPIFEEGGAEGALQAPAVQG
jgi:NAD(P)-dependent dehydrogenase (short-subunit alcohol dehydrogenase family)